MKLQFAKSGNSIHIFDPKVPRENGCDECSFHVDGFYCECPIPKKMPCFENRFSGSWKHIAVINR